MEPKWVKLELQAKQTTRITPQANPIRLTQMREKEGTDLAVFLRSPKDEKLEM